MRGRVDVTVLRRRGALVDVGFSQSGIKVDVTVLRGRGVLVDVGFSQSRIKVDVTVLRGRGALVDWLLILTITVEHNIYIYHVK